MIEFFRFSVKGMELGVALRSGVVVGVDLGEGIERYIKRAWPGEEISEGREPPYKVLKEFESYLSGRRERVELPFEVRGTLFRRRVWDEILRIPFGEVRTYGQVASAIGMPRACRAVGSACGANPVPLIIPCHRVVSAGGIGGFSAGLDIKRRLFELEGISLS